MRNGAECERKKRIRINLSRASRHNFTQSKLLLSFFWMKSVIRASFCTSRLIRRWQIWNIFLEGIKLKCCTLKNSIFMRNEVRKWQCMSPSGPVNSDCMLVALLESWTNSSLIVHLISRCPKKFCSRVRSLWPSRSFSSLSSVRIVIECSSIVRVWVYRSATFISAAIHHI